MGIIDNTVELTSLHYSSTAFQFLTFEKTLASKRSVSYCNDGTDLQGSSRNHLSTHYGQTLFPGESEYNLVHVTVIATSHWLWMSLPFQSSPLFYNEHCGCCLLDRILKYYEWPVLKSIYQTDSNFETNLSNNTRFA